MSKAENVRAQEKFGDAINSGKLDAMKDVVAPDSVDHDPAPGQAQGPEGFIHFFTSFRKAFPDLKVAVEHLVADDDNVCLPTSSPARTRATSWELRPPGRESRPAAFRSGALKTASWPNAGAVPMSWEF